MTAPDERLAPEQFDEPIPLFEVAPVAAMPTGNERTHTPGQRRRDRQLAAILAGQHPLSVVLGALPLHVDARRDGDRTGDGSPRCGGCRFREQLHGGARSYPKCGYGTSDRTREATSAERAMYGLNRIGVVIRPRVSHGEGTDVSAWWPACRDYSPKQATS